METFEELQKAKFRLHSISWKEFTRELGCPVIQLVG